MATTDLSGAHWVKSSYSNNGGSCVEVALTTAQWRKSTHSQNGGNCIEVAPDFTGLVPVRDSKDPAGPALLFPTDAWRAFLTAVKADEFDLL
ncbi:DUF397 domain-containing protein [Kitasatospora sp. NPDC002551]|uniref:DUF397 domain-containing protein n=1 Tax=Kitasatospora sp. NPDC002551 TaxID=3154539 RepID=UPI00331D08B5